MRDQEWLEKRFIYIKEKYFSDISFENVVSIQFGRRARTRLGSIRKKPAESVLERLKGIYETQITITGYFRYEQVPTYVVDATISHELAHYTHGFSSPLEQKARYPHKGGLVRSELNKRGLGDIENKQKIWIKKNWQNFLKNNTY